MNSKDRKSIVAIIVTTIVVVSVLSVGISSIMLKYRTRLFIISTPQTIIDTSDYTSPAVKVRLVKEESGRKTFRNEMIGYEFTVPEGWEVSSLTDNSLTIDKADNVFYFSTSLANPRESYETEFVFKEEILIDGFTAFKSVYRRLYDRNSYQVFSGFYRKDMGLEFSFDLFYYGSDYNEVHEQMISSFHFI